MVHDAQLLLRRGVAGLGLGEDRGVDLLDVARVLADAGERVRERGRDEHGHFVLSFFRRRRAVVVGLRFARVRGPRAPATRLAHYNCCGGLVVACYWFTWRRSSGSCVALKMCPRSHSQRSNRRPESANTEMGQHVAWASPIVRVHGSVTNAVQASRACFLGL